MSSELPQSTEADRFDAFAKDLMAKMKRRYDRGVNRDLSQQQWHELFKRNVTTVLRQAYQDALTALQEWPRAAEAPQNNAGISQETSQVLQSFEGCVEEIVVYALQKNRTSCALSNFPQEANPSEQYLYEVIEETSRDWSAFTLQVANLMSH